MKRGKLTFIGLGLFDENDISIKGLSEIKKSDKIYAEFYTAKLMGADIEKLEKIFNKKIIILDREKTEKDDKQKYQTDVAPKIQSAPSRAS